MAKYENKSRKYYRENADLVRRIREATIRQAFPSQSDWVSYLTARIVKVRGY